MSKGFGLRWFIGGTLAELLIAWYMMVALSWANVHVGYWAMFLLVMGAAGVVSLGIVGGLYSTAQYNKEK